MRLPFRNTLIINDTVLVIEQIILLLLDSQERVSRVLRQLMFEYITTRNPLLKLLLVHVR